MYRFEVNYWDELSHEPATDKGIVAAEDYGHAANRLVEYYGSENIVDIKLCELNDILLDEDVTDACKT